MDNNKFDYLIPEISHSLAQYYFNLLSIKKEFQEPTVDSAPLLNMTIGVFVSCLINSLDNIKKQTMGEVELMENIELAKNNILKAIEYLPFISKVEFI